MLQTTYRCGDCGQEFGLLGEALGKDEPIVCLSCWDTIQTTVLIIDPDEGTESQNQHMPTTLEL